ncbi:MAG: glucose inhibited division protein [Pseudobdellovibrio sp.]|jgi:16S rRNA (guanine527-N7)-methyltransferase|nr:glucose inhibited division protein [Pseudobdellovibrio sp.]
MTADHSANWRIKTWFPDIDEKTHEHLYKYFTELQKFNKVVNLISPKTVLHADAVHFADSILASRAVSKKVNKSIYLYDIGSGNGFPGLIYAILNPDQKMALIDSDERKCEFMKHIADTLGLSGVVVQNKKVELLPSNTIEQAICRGFAPLPKALLTLRKAVKKGGNVYHMKAEEWAMEVSQIPTQLCSIWQPALESEYKLPIGDIKMFVVKTTKLD